MADHEITLTVNGTRETLTVESRTLLVHALRDRLGYTAPNVGCESGKCGACTVSVDGDAVKSCTVLAVAADGARIRTAAGYVDDGALHPIQESFREEHGLQCGYCTPGMIPTVEELLSADPDPSRPAIRRALKGNVCRCTGYENVIDAVETAAERMATDAPVDPGGRSDDGGEREAADCPDADRESRDRNDRPRDGPAPDPAAEEN